MYSTKYGTKILEINKNKLNNMKILSNDTSSTYNSQFNFYFTIVYAIVTVLSYIQFIQNIKSYFCVPLYHYCILTLNMQYPYFFIHMTILVFHRLKPHLQEPCQYIAYRLQPFIKSSGIPRLYHSIISIQ